MRPLTCLILALAVLAAGMIPMAARGAPAADEWATQVVEIPWTGMAATLPAGWRVWFAGEPGRPSALLATDVATRQSCTFELMEGVASAERAAHETVKAVESHPQHEVVERTFLVVPAGNAVRVAYRFKDAPDDPRYLLDEYYLTVSGGVLLAHCSSETPPDDRWLSVIEGITSRVADSEPLTTFDPRVEIPAHGFAIDFPEEWLVRSWPGPGPVLGGQLVLRAVTATDADGCEGCECVLEDDSALPELVAAGSPEAWQAVLLSSAQDRGHQAVEPVVSQVDLPSGPAVRADWDRWSGTPATTWIYLDEGGHAIAALLCRADASPDDGWRSLAETFDFLPGAR